MISDIRFADPQYGQLLWLVLAAGCTLLWLDSRGAGKLDQFIASVMHMRLVRRPGRGRRRLRIALITATGCLLVLALMRPQWGFQRVHLPRVGAQIMICLDVSNSMLAEDVAPNRLDRAKAELDDLLKLLDGDHVGLIAFAGKATVLCPMTPDYASFRMILDNTSTESVARGGTDLEQPIRKAIAGFRGESDISRIIILITDGEDHDSFVLDAAEMADRRGINIIAIGFGDQDGSDILITDPDTGAKTRLLDDDGNPVITRLDSEMLQKIAMTTGGVYIPAGTGQLDLKAIHEAHIAPLMRGRLDDKTRLLRHEAYHWAVLAAMVTLLASVLVDAAVDRRTPPASSNAVAVAVSFLLLTSASTACGQHHEEQKMPHNTQIGEQTTEQIETDNHQEIQVQEPRQLYNHAVEMLRQNRLDDAEDQFIAARDHAAHDGQLRYAASYNLAWVELKRADALLDDQPEKAIHHLHAAADWFRDAIALQPDEIQPRENLEITTQRAIALADAVNRRDDVEIEQKLDQLIAGQRAVVDQLRDCLENNPAEEHLDIAGRFREPLRRLESEQRALIAELDYIAVACRDEADAIAAINEDDRTTEQNLRNYQLSGCMTSLQHAADRMGKVRTLLRKAQTERAFRRAAAAIDELKQARDQFRNILELLNELCNETSQLARFAGRLAAGSLGIDTGDSGDGESLPVWLSREFLQDQLAAVQNRHRHLNDWIEAGLHSSNDQQNQQQQQLNDNQRRQQQKIIETLQEAQPLIRDAATRFDDADIVWQSDDDKAAYHEINEAAECLIMARELFLDIKAIIELIYADQKMIRNILHDDLNRRPEVLSEYLVLFEQVERKNADRAERLRSMIEEEIDRLTQPDDDPHEDTQDRQNDGQQKQLMQLALQLLGNVMTSFDNVLDAAGRLKTNIHDDAGITDLMGYVDKSIEQIESLRRIFFSIVEHIKDAARKQIRLADETQRLITNAKTDQVKITEQQIGPLQYEQRQLAEFCQQIAKSLQEQARRNPADHAATTAMDHAESKEQARSLEMAAKLVNDANTEMMAAAQRMKPGDIDQMQSDEIDRHQGQAAQKLLQAVDLLQPQQQQQQDSQKQQQQQQQQGGSDDQQKQNEQDKMQQKDMANLLQAVRDREAKSNRDKNQRGTSEYEPVRKDW